LEVETVPPQTILHGVLPDQSDLDDLLMLCSDLGLEILSLHRLPS
jgi:hypothetical protein